MQEEESEIVKWIKELKERRGKLDMQINELDQETVRIKWRIAQLEEFKRKTEEGAIQVPQSEIIAEKAEVEMKALARLKGEKSERRGEIVVERDFCNALVNYLRSKLESAQEKPAPS